MILSKIVLAATMSATALWLAPIHGNGQHPAHEQCACGHDHCDADCGVDCDHEHCGADCGHEDADYAALTAASPDAHAGHSHSAVYAKEKCDQCNGKGKVECWSCNGQGKWKETCRTCNGKQVVRVPGKLTAQGCKACGGTGKEKFVCSSCSGKGKVTCSKCDGKGKL
jgi:hypothetical protein